MNSMNVASFWNVLLDLLASQYNRRWREGTAQAFRYCGPSDVSGDDLGSPSSDNPGGWMSRGGNGSEASTAERSPVQFLWKNAVFGSWCLFLTHLFIAAAVTVLQMTLCWPPAELWVPWLCPLMPSRSNTHRSHSLLCLHCRLFQFLLPLLLITKHVLLIPHLWKLPSSLQHFQTSCRLAKPSATWLAASLLRSVFKLCPSLHQGRGLVNGLVPLTSRELYDWFILIVFIYLWCTFILI